MQTRPPDLDDADLARLLEERWAFRPVSLEYLPVGFGGYHWHATDAKGTRLFVTVDALAQERLGPDPDSALDALDRAFRTAAFLRDEAGLEFVVGPIGSTHRLDDYAVTPFPYVEGTSGTDERPRLLELLGRLHAADVPADLAQRDDFAIPNRASLLEALDRPWTSGPYAEPTRQLLRRHAEEIAQRLHAYDELAPAVAETSNAWVVTHGEPHSRNVIRDAADRLFLVDWDAVKLAPRERDLWMVEGARGDRDALHLYGERWVLADVAEFVHLFRSPHEYTADTEKAWRALAGYLEN